jgi:hypothetical protein
MKLFGGYDTPRKYAVFSRMALKSYDNSNEFLKVAKGENHG